MNYDPSCQQVIDYVLSALTHHCGPNFARHFVSCHNSTIYVSIHISNVSLASENLWIVLIDSRICTYLYNNLIWYQTSHSIEAICNSIINNEGTKHNIDIYGLYAAACFMNLYYEYCAFSKMCY